MVVCGCGIYAGSSYFYLPYSWVLSSSVSSLWRIRWYHQFEYCGFKLECRHCMAIVNGHVTQYVALPLSNFEPTSSLASWWSPVCLPFCACKFVPCREGRNFFQVYRIGCTRSAKAHHSASFQKRRDDSIQSNNTADNDVTGGDGNRQR